MVNKLSDNYELEVVENDDIRTLVLTGSTDIYDKNKKEEFSFTIDKANGRLPDEYLLKALELSGGNVTRAARIIGIDRSVYYQRRNDIEGFSEKMDDIREQKLDFAEDKLWEHIEVGNLPAVMFYLRTIGKRRGYTTQVELVGNEEKPLNIQINLGSESKELDEFSDFS